MKNMEILIEYEEIMTKKRKDFSLACINRIKTPKEVQEVLRYIVEEIFHWTPEQTKNMLTPEVAQQLHIKRLINLIEFPPELNEKSDYFYVAYFLYPEKMAFPKKQLILHVYEKVLSGELKKFPKNFFLLGYAETNLHLCIQYALNHYKCFHSLEEAYAFFADRKKFYSFAKNVRLLDAIQLLYDCPIDLLHESLSPNSRDEFLYMYYRYQYYMKYGGQNL